jgi:hypothetical protein
MQRSNIDLGQEPLPVWGGGSFCFWPILEVI